MGLGRIFLAYCLVYDTLFSWDADIAARPQMASKSG
jgi:hypothetical protein